MGIEGAIAIIGLVVVICSLCKPEQPKKKKKKDNLIEEIRPKGLPSMDPLNSWIPPQ